MTMFTIKRAAAFLLIGVLAFLMGCGSEGPLGNNAPQGRPEWMKKDNSPPPASPQKQQ
jgi:hypothetical protein